MKRLIPFVLIMIMAVSCDSASATSHDGTYNFDVTSWTTEMGKHDANFAKAPPQAIEAMKANFGKFNIVITDGKATLNFGPQMTVAGKVEQQSSADGTVVYKLTPDDPAKQKEPILLRITGNKMVAGPEGNPKQLLYFIKK